MSHWAARGDIRCRPVRRTRMSSRRGVPVTAPLHVEPRRRQAEAISALASASTRCGRRRLKTRRSRSEKLDYVFGKGTGSIHTITRSQAMRDQLERIGLHDTPAARQYVADQIQKVFAQPGIMQANGRVLRESMLMGPSGGVKMQTIWEGSNLITVILFGAGAK